jgi:hypothetical protein
VSGITVGSRRHQDDMIAAIEASDIKPILDKDFPLDQIAGRLHASSQRRRFRQDHRLALTHAAGAGSAGADGELARTSPQSTGFSVTPLIHTELIRLPQSVFVY